MTIKTFIIAAVTGLSLLAALPASAHQGSAHKGSTHKAQTHKVQKVNHFKRGHGDRHFMPLRQIFRIFHKMERREMRHNHGRRHYRYYDNRRNHKRRNNRRYY